MEFKRFINFGGKTITDSEKKFYPNLKRTWPHTKAKVTLFLCILNKSFT